MKKYLLSIMLLLSFINVNAKCSYSELSDLNSEAANVKVSYDIIEKDIGQEDVLISRTFDITILNVSKNLYVKITNNIDKTTKYIHNSDTNNGMYTFNWENSSKVTNFIIDIYASSETMCENDKLKTIKMSTPRYNDYSNRVICEELEGSSFCEKYVMFDEMNEEDFMNKVASFKSDKPIIHHDPDPNELNLIGKILKFINDNKVVIIISLVGVTGTIGFISYRNNKKLKKAGLK